MNRNLAKGEMKGGSGVGKGRKASRLRGLYELGRLAVQSQRWCYGSGAGGLGLQILLTLINY